MAKKSLLDPIGVDELPALESRLPSQESLHRQFLEDVQSNLKKNWGERVKQFESFRDEAEDVAERDRWQKKIDDLQRRFGETHTQPARELPKLSEEAKPVVEAVEEPAAPKSKLKEIVEEVATPKEQPVPTRGRPQFSKEALEKARAIMGVDKAPESAPAAASAEVVEEVVPETPKAKVSKVKAPKAKPMQLPVPTDVPTSSERNIFDKMIKGARSEAGTIAEDIIELPESNVRQLPAVVDDVIETTGKTISDIPVSKSRLAPLLKGVAKPLAVISAAKDAYDVGTSLREGDYRQAAEQAGSALGGLGGAAVGSAAGPAGTIGGGVAGSYAGGKAAGALYDAAGNYLGDSEQGSSLVDSFLLMPETARKREQERKINEPIRRLEALRDTAKTAEERGYLEQVIKRTKQKMTGVSDEDILAGEEARQRELLSYKRPESVEKADKLASDPESIYSDFIGNTESNNNYNAVNPKTGALGKYQIIKKWHKDAIEKRYNMSFEDAMKNPEIQEDYFKKVLLPQYRKDASALAKTPEAKERGLDEFTLTGMMQLGKGNVMNFLRDNVTNDIADQMYYFQGKADQYKRNLASEKADIDALKDREAQMQEEGKYIPFKSAQAKMDTLRSGETTMTREEAEALNQASKMREQDGIQKSASFIPFKSAEDKMRTLEEQQAAQEKEPEAGGYIQQPDEVVSVKEQQAAKPKSRLEEALELQNRMEMLGNLSRSSELLGRGIGSAITKMAPTKMTGGEFEETLSKIGKQGVEGAKLLDEEETKKDEQDPLSEKSKRARESLSAVLGRDIPESLSFSDIKTLKLSDLALKTTAAGAKLSTANQKRLTDFSKELDPTRGRTGEFGELYKVANRATRLEQLMAKGKNLTGPEMEELAIGTARILSGTGAGSRSQVEALVPQTIRGDMMKTIQWITNQPTGLGQQKFVERTMALLDRERKTAKTAMGNIIKQRATAYKKELEHSDPEVKKQFSDVYESALNEYGLGQPSVEKQLSTEPAPTEKKTVKLAEGKERKPGSIVSISGVKYKVGEDGRELIPLE